MITELAFRRFLAQSSMTFLCNPTLIYEKHKQCRQCVKTHCHVIDMSRIFRATVHVKSWKWHRLFPRISCQNHAIFHVKSSKKHKHFMKIERNLATMFFISFLWKTWIFKNFNDFGRMLVLKQQWPPGTKKNIQAITILHNAKLW